jgi:hypothetical protein
MKPNCFGFNLNFDEIFALEPRQAKRLDRCRVAAMAGIRASVLGNIGVHVLDLYKP